MNIVGGFLVKMVKESEAMHINYYKARKELWLEWRSTKKLEILLKFFHH